MNDYYTDYEYFAIAKAYLKLNGKEFNISTDDITKSVIRKYKRKKENNDAWLVCKAKWDKEHNDSILAWKAKCDAACKAKGMI